MACSAPQGQLGFPFPLLASKRSGPRPSAPPWPSRCAGSSAGAPHSPSLGLADKSAPRPVSMTMRPHASAPSPTSGRARAGLRRWKSSAPNPDFWILPCEDHVWVPYKREQASAASRFPICVSFLALASSRRRFWISPSRARPPLLLTPSAASLPFETHCQAPHRGDEAVDTFLPSSFAP